MKILFAASEAAPYAKTGGLADVAGSLPVALAGLGHDVRVIMPRYRQVDAERFGLRHIAAFFVPLGSWKERCDVMQADSQGNVTVYFVNKDVYFNRPELYRSPHGDYHDNSERFIFFSRAVLETCRTIGFSPDVIHCNDWQTGLVPYYLKKLYAKAAPLDRARTVFTVHNLGYQGVFWHWDMRLIAAGWEDFTPEGLEFWGKLNFLKAGLVYSDVITTVSRTYSREIQTPQYGHGLDGVLAKRSRDLHGILNGIDYNEWDPAHDRNIAEKFSVARPSGKSGCKKALQRLVDLPMSDAPLIGMVTRLADQKGLDILTETLPELMNTDARLVILGTGEEKYHRILAEISDRYKARMRAILQFDEALARAVYAGSDLFLMPSLYEPCGLGQLISLRYGTVPVVRKTGGLADTVQDYDPGSGKGSGFVFTEYSAKALAACVRRAINAYRDRKKWALLVRSCMKRDFSWEHSAKEYVKLYKTALRKKR